VAIKQKSQKSAKELRYYLTELGKNAKGEEAL